MYLLRHSRPKNAGRLSTEIPGTGEPSAGTCRGISQVLQWPRHDRRRTTWKPAAPMWINAWSEGARNHQLALVAARAYLGADSMRRGSLRRGARNRRGICRIRENIAA
jgi:hypothetical protein